MFHAYAVSIMCDRQATPAHRHQLEVVEVAVGTVAGALERLIDAQARRAHAVRDVDDARELLELPEQLLRHQAVVAGARGHSAPAGDKRDEGKIGQEQAAKRGHGCGVLHGRGAGATWPGVACACRASSVGGRGSGVGATIARLKAWQTWRPLYVIGVWSTHPAR